MKIIAIILVAIGILFWAQQRSEADPGLHFHCSVCGSHSHGSLWHDKNK